MPKSPLWTYDQTLIALRVYLNTEFGRLHNTNPEIVRIAGLLERSPSALGMKCCNFASLDPFHAARGVKGLANRGGVEEQVWSDFQTHPDEVVEKMEQEWERLAVEGIDGPKLVGDEPDVPEGPSETTRTVRVRRLQRAFRSAVLVGYKQRCALTGLSVTSLLNASHIIPWSVSEGRRSDPRNGICLNALHDRAFDRGLMTFDEQFRAVLSRELHHDERLGRFTDHFAGLEGQPLAMPERFGPLPEAMSYHRENVFQSA
ncbi:MAG: HNH endonuclease [Planctomycetota bacterium]